MRYLPSASVFARASGRARRGLLLGASVTTTPGTPRSPFVTRPATVAVVCAKAEAAAQRTKRSASAARDFERFGLSSVLSEASVVMADFLSGAAKLFWNGGSREAEL